jgi:predicted acylesterase/phospholipase RssA
MKYPENPTLECDIVMKGGLTSGVIYPRAVCKLATTYRLRSVGGSSAGAIAAAGVAAAELGRTTGGFELLEALPHDITDESPAGGSVLHRLFQPTKQTYPLYRVLTAGMGTSARNPDGQGGSGKNTVGRRKIAKTLRIFVALLTGFWQWGLAGAALGVVLVVVSVFGRGPAVVAGLLGGLTLLLLGAAVGIAYGSIRVLAGMAGTGFGICTGRAGHRAKGAKALTPLLHERLQAMAGRPDGPVLTFGDLASAGIELRMMTTNLTRRQPMPMPWTMQEYFFEPDEMRALFPDDVVEWMEAHPPSVGTDGKVLSPKEARKRDLLRAQAKTKRPWPAPDDVPVIVATRMSLSFPVLITAVPLYAVNYALAVNRDASDAADRWLAAHPDRPAAEGASEVAVEPKFDANWFSDGGVCANLPVHFFDAPLPTRPTFAIDLEDSRRTARRAATSPKTAISQSKTMPVCCARGRHCPAPAPKPAPVPRPPPASPQSRASKRSDRSCTRLSIRLAAGWTPRSW